MGRTMGTAWLDFARDACALGDADSCWQAGWEAAYGRSKSDEGAVRIDFERGCRAGHALSCLAAADRLREDGDFAGAVMLYGQACAGHHEVGCDLSAHTRRLSESVAACTAGDIAACQWSCPRVSDDAICALALPATVDACDNRGGEACTLLGYIYGAGRGVEADPDRANALLWLGCDLDDPRACLRLEDNLSRRRGAPPSGSRAIPWLRNQVCDLQMDYGCAPHRFWE